MHNKVTKRIHVTFYLAVHLWWTWHCIWGCSNGSSEDAATFEIEIKSALEATIELQLKIHIVMYLLKQNSAQNDSIYGEIEETLHIPLEGGPKISL